MRIISGKYKGRIIAPPRNLRARPTTDFAKENLFNVLAGLVDIEECDVLDLFAGTGSVSYEFASRGARSVTAVEINAVHLDFIRRTATELGLMASDVSSFRRRGTTDRKPAGERGARDERMDSSLSLSSMPASETEVDSDLVSGLLSGSGSGSGLASGSGSDSGLLLGLVSGSGSGSDLVSGSGSGLSSTPTPTPSPYTPSQSLLRASSPPRFSASMPSSAPASFQNQTSSRAPSPAASSYRESGSNERGVGFFPVKANVFNYLRACSRQFDLIFSDAPYDLKGSEEVISLVFERKLLRPAGATLGDGSISEGGLLIFEHSRGCDFSAHPHFLQTRSYGSVQFTFFRA